MAGTIHRRGFGKLARGKFIVKKYRHLGRSLCEFIQIMGYRYEVFPEENYVLQRYWGTVGFREVEACIQAMWRDKHYRPEMRGIADLREIETHAVPNDILSVVKLLQSPMKSRGRWAAIFAEPRGTALGILFCNQFPRLLSLHICSTWDRACEFTGLQADPLPYRNQE